MPFTDKLRLLFYVGVKFVAQWNEKTFGVLHTLVLFYVKRLKLLQEEESILIMQIHSVYFLFRSHVEQLSQCILQLTIKSLLF